MIFHGVEGTAEQHRDSPSWFNDLEAVCVMEYVKNLLLETNGIKVEAKDIGIISPYHRQVS